MAGIVSRVRMCSTSFFPPRDGSGTEVDDSSQQRGRWRSYGSGSIRREEPCPKDP